MKASSISFLIILAALYYSCSIICHASSISAICSTTANETLCIQTLKSTQNCTNDDLRCMARFVTKQAINAAKNVQNIAQLLLSRQNKSGPNYQGTGPLNDCATNCNTTLYYLGSCYGPLKQSGSSAQTNLLNWAWFAESYLNNCDQDFGPSVEPQELAAASSTAKQLIEILLTVAVIIPV
ncbi:Unknown protein [Striga hermonthica]|uniref:Pectinesterase inhibitor domain-containing protein n=1 Tax=Striga hermonthica TaxID=68872 RepID=A0A9N7RJN0_STRHE|nr:Unknown protein [Striga hermonthica]